MKLSAPKLITWWIALIIGVIGIIANFVTIPVLSGFAFWLVVIGLVRLTACSNQSRGGTFDVSIIGKWAYLEFQTLACV